MKLPKTTNRHCPFCNSHTEHKISEVSGKQGSSFKKGSKERAKERGEARGFGNQGRHSRPAIGSRKRTGVSASKKYDLRYECQECGKKHPSKKSIRAKRLEISDR